MNDPNYCPLCKFSSSHEIDNSKQLKLVKCEECGNFIISYAAEEYLSRTVVEREKYSDLMKNYDSKGFYPLIFMKNGVVSVSTMDSVEWNKKKQQA
jgi:hypothetical protein